MTPEAAINLVESFWEEVWAACDPSAVDRFVTDDFVITSAGVDVAGREEFKAWVAGFQSNIADLKWETIETFANARQRHLRGHAHRQARPQLGRTQRLGALQPAQAIARQFGAGEGDR